MTSLEIKVYTEKSIVVTGNSTEYKEELLNFGGKWNANLTDKISGDKFSGWIFPTNKKTMLEKWLKEYNNPVKIKSLVKSSHEANSTEERLDHLEKKVDKLILLLTKVVEKAEDKSNDYDVDGFQKPHHMSEESVPSFAKSLLKTLFEPVKTIKKVQTKKTVPVSIDVEDIEEVSTAPLKRLLKK